MATFRLTLNTDNAAFGDDAAPEVTRILNDLADGIYSGECFNGSYEPGGPVLDANGNRVGRWEWVDDDAWALTSEAAGTIDHT